MDKELNEKIEEIRSFIIRGKLPQALASLTDAVELLAKKPTVIEAIKQPVIRKKVATKTSAKA